MLETRDVPPADDYVDPVSSDPKAFAAMVNSWVPHDIVLKDAWFPLAHGFAATEKPVRRAHSIVPQAGHRSGSPTHAIIQPLAENWTDEAPQALAAPEATENPRLRIMRGGVWW